MRSVAPRRQRRASAKSAAMRFDERRSAAAAPDYAASRDVAHCDDDSANDQRAWDRAGRIDRLAGSVGHMCQPRRRERSHDCGHERSPRWSASGRCADVGVAGVAGNDPGLARAECNDEGDCAYFYAVSVA